MPRKYTDARKDSNRKWDAANLDRLSLALPKGSKDKIKAHAESMGESVNGFIGRAIENQMANDIASAPTDAEQSTAVADKKEDAEHGTT